MRLVDRPADSIRAKYTPAATAAQARHREIDGTRRTYYCGAWWRNGFHEDGVVSALDALRHFRQDFYTSTDMR